MLKGQPWEALEAAKGDQIGGVGRLDEVIVQILFQTLSCGLYRGLGR